MTTAQKYTIAGRLRRAIIDLAQAGNYVERGDAPRTVANIGTAVDHLTEALATIRAGAPDYNNTSKNVGRGRAPRPSGPKPVALADGDLLHNVHDAPPRSGDPQWGTLRSPWLACGCGKKDVRGRRTNRLKGRPSDPGHHGHSTWHRNRKRSRAMAGPP